MVPTKSRQKQVTAASHGPLKPTLERLPDHYLRRMEWLLSAIRRDFYWPEEGSRKAIVQYSIHNQRWSPHALVSHGERDREHDVCLWWRRWKILAQRLANFWSDHVGVVWSSRNSRYRSGRPPTALSHNFWEKDIYLWRWARLVPITQRHLLSWHEYADLGQTASHRAGAKCTSFHNWLPCRF